MSLIGHTLTLQELQLEFLLEKKKYSIISIPYLEGAGFVSLFIKFKKQDFDKRQKSAENTINRKKRELH